MPEPIAPSFASSPQERASAEVTQLFVALTPDRVLAAVEAAGLEPTGLCYPLNSFENRVYEVELADRTRRVGKFYRPGRWSREQVLAEHRFLAELEEDEVPVLAPLELADGSTLGEIDGIFFAFWRRQGGRAPDELDRAGAARLGRLVARIHRVGANGEAAPRPRLDADRYVRHSVAWMIDKGIVPARFEARYVEAARAIAALYEERAAGVALQRIHADLHLGNLLLRDDRLWVVDFDDMALGPPVQDVWLALPGRDAESLRLRDILLDAYEELFPFDRRTLDLVEPLRGLRMVRYTAWLARRYSDPAFKAGWPEFGTAEYWREATEDLEAQRREAERRSPDAARATAGVADARSADLPADPDALTNKDYFWDWEG